MQNESQTAYPNRTAQESIKLIECHISPNPDRAFTKINQVNKISYVQ